MVEGGQYKYHTGSPGAKRGLKKSQFIFWYKNKFPIKVLCNYCIEMSFVDFMQEIQWKAKQLELKNFLKTFSGTYILMYFQDLYT